MNNEKQPKKKKMIVKLGEDDKETNYKKPNITVAEKITDDQLVKMLEDYVKVKPTTLVKSDHVRYFTVNKDKTTSFKIGGHVMKIDGLPKYIILTNGKQNWSVQCDNTIFYKKMTNTEKIDELNETIDDLKFQIIRIKDEFEIERNELKENIKNLQKELKKKKK